MTTHKAQGWAEPFNDDAAKARDQHQQAITEAHAMFKQAEADAWRQRNADYAAAKDAWDAVKSLPDSPEVTEGREAFDRAKAPASLTQARRALAEAIQKADQNYKRALVAAGQKHNVSVTMHDPR